MGLKGKRNVNVVFKATEGSEMNQSAASEYPSFTGSTGAQAIPAAFPWVLVPAQSEGCDGTWILSARAHNTPCIALITSYGHGDHRTLCSPLVLPEKKRRADGNYF